MGQTINLRSDTVSKPTPEMRRAMAEAEVGDDYYREDSTVLSLEERAAGIFRKEAAMLVFSATMSNLVSVLAQTDPGQSVIVEEASHIYNNEAGFLSAFCGVTPRPVKGHRGRIEPAQVKAAVFPKGILHPQTGLLCIENTHNAAGGCCLSLEQTEDLCRTAHDLGLNVHLDGARIFNASVALGVPVHELAADADSVTLCLTKGLGCPVGAIVLGPEEFVARARQWRQVAGGGMRQAGVFAAAGLVALDTMVDRLAEDHANAKRLATLLAEAGLHVDPPPEECETNIVFAEVPETIMDATRFVALLQEGGVVVNAPKGRRVRFITQHGVSADDIEFAGTCVRNIISAG